LLVVGEEGEAKAKSVGGCDVAIFFELTETEPDVDVGVTCTGVGGVTLNEGTDTGGAKLI